MFSRLLTVSMGVIIALFITSCGGSGLESNTQFSTASSNATLQQVGRTIITASAYQGWQPQIAGPGRIIATRHHAGRLAKVSIDYTTSSFTINYIDSDNMGYTGSSISSTYDDWIDDLRNEIKTRLSNL